MHTFFASDKRSCKHTMTTVLIVQTLVRMKKKQNFSDEELMQVMGLDLPSSKSGTETHGETVSETMAPIFDEPESMEQPAPVPETERGQPEEPSFITGQTPEPTARRRTSGKQRKLPRASISLHWIRRRLTRRTA